jgi:SulP family sulfate permease
MGTRIGSGAVLDQEPELSGFRRVVPGVSSIVDGARHSLGRDTRAALTVWAVVVPQSLAYATLAGVPSVHGLYAAVAALAAYAVFGTCRDLNMGAESTVALMVAAAVAPVATDPDNVIALTSLAAILVGGWCVLGFVFRLGFISELLHGLTTVIGVATIVLVLGLRRFVPRIPAPLVAVALGIALVAGFDLDQDGVAVVGAIDSGVPLPRLPGASIDQFAQLLLPSLGIALLAYPDSFLTARSLSTTGGYTLDANQEFLAIGASNVASGLLQGIAVNGSQSRSFVQRDAGGASNVVGLLCAVLVLLTLFFLIPVFEQLPLSVLAGIVIVAGISLFELEGFRALWDIRRSEFWLGTATVV